MAFRFRKDKGQEKQPLERPGDWVTADPYGHAARRWYDVARGWTDRVEGAGQAPDKTGLPGVDERRQRSNGLRADVDANQPAPRSVAGGLGGRHASGVTTDS